jgi:predicted GIY-YIG superfamily endonuclease
MLRYSDSSFYVGIAIDVEERVKRHNWGIGPQFTARRRPVELVWSECCGNAVAARAREKEIKGRNRKKKFELIEKATGKPFVPKAGSG